jgi:hypothetical protein
MGSRPSARRAIGLSLFKLDHRPSPRMEITGVLRQSQSKLAVERVSC